MARIYKYISTICLYLVMYYLTLILVPIYGETQPQSQSQVEPKPNCQRCNSSGPIIERDCGFEHSSPNVNKPCGKPLNRNQTRVGSIDKKQNHHRYSSNSLTDYPINSDYGSLFTVTVSLGTPKQYYNLIVDTGSRWTWVRCQSCITGCISDDPALYDPSNSSCKNTLPAGPFYVIYGDNSFIKGIWGCDTLTIDGLGSIMNFKFGCGQVNIDRNGENFVNASGYLGLGKGEFSLASQSGASMQMFSYFVPENGGDADLNFGDKARDKSNTCSNQFTPLVQGIYQEKYYIDLVGISVDGNELSVVPRGEFMFPRTIIDSGTVITRLPEDVYYALRDAFREFMSSYTLLYKVDDLLDTCYNSRVEQIVLPEIKFHFGQETSIDVTLSKSGIIWRKSDTITCLAFASTEIYKNSIIGIVQQRGFNVLYDLEGGRIGFGTNCAAT